MGALCFSLRLLCRPDQCNNFPLNSRDAAFLQNQTVGGGSGRSGQEGKRARNASSRGLN